jgi:hypothetical protein
MNLQKTTGTGSKLRRLGSESNPPLLVHTSKPMFSTKPSLIEKTTLFSIDNHSDKQVTVTTHFTHPETGEKVGEYSYIVFCERAYLSVCGDAVLVRSSKWVGRWVTCRLNDGVTEVSIPSVSYALASKILNRRTSWWGRVINALSGFGSGKVFAPWN